VLPLIPKNVVVLEWGYEGNHPFKQSCALLAKENLKFYVCPGTSSWNSIGGRTDNAIKNLENAALNGLKNGAIGYLITDWGDNGHWQPLPVSYVGLTLGASFSWNVKSSNIYSEKEVYKLLDNFVFYDEGQVMGKLFYGLGNTYSLIDVPLPNGSWLARIFIQPNLQLKESGITVETVNRVLNYINQVMSPIGHANMKREDAGQIIKEANWVADMLRFSCKIYLNRLQSTDIDSPIHMLPAEIRKQFRDSLRDLINRHKEIWAKRNRSGGLSDSVARLEDLLQQFKTPEEISKSKEKSDKNSKNKK